MHHQERKGLWKPNIKSRAGPLYLAIADSLAEDLRNGKLAPGDRLPPHRLLAQWLSVDLTTATRGYAEAQKRGLICGRGRRGTFVSDAGLNFGQGVATNVDMTFNVPPQLSNTSIRQKLQDGLAQIFKETDFPSQSTYGSGAGSPRDKAAAQIWLRDRMGVLPLERVAVTNGTQVSIVASLMAVSQPGDLVLTEALTHSGFKSAAEQLGLRLRGIAMDSDGLIPDELERACREDEPKLLYCVPTLHNPTTITMPEARRTAVASIAKKYDLLIVEDDIYGLISNASPPPIAKLLPDQTIYLSGLAKAITPALRIAYVVFPNEALGLRVKRLLNSIGTLPSPIMRALSTQWIFDGTGQLICSALRQEAIERQELARAILPHKLIKREADAYHLWLRLPPTVDRKELSLYLLLNGLSVPDNTSFAVSDSCERGIRLALGAARTQKQLSDALLMLSSAITQRRYEENPHVI